MALAPLWHGHTPDWADSQWRKLKTRLLNIDQHWRVWTDWYEARLRGDPANEALEIARVLLPDDLWNKGPDEINPAIQRLMESPSTSHVLERLPGSDDMDELVAWARHQSRKTAIRVAVRSALRVLPLLAKPANVRDPTAKEKLLLQVFRGLALSWTSGAWAKQAKVGPVAERLEQLADRAGDFPSRCLSTAAFWTATTVDRGSDHVEALENAHSYAVETAHAAAADVGFLQGVRDALKADMKAVDEGKNLSRQPLWLVATPPWVNEQWEALMSWLVTRDPTWEVWANWYDQRVASAAPDKEQDVLVYQIPDATWDGDVSSANREFRRLIDEHFRLADAECGEADDKWPNALLTAQQSPLGAKFEASGEFLAFVPAGDESDAAAAAQVATQQLHEEVRRRAAAFASAIGDRLENQIGWRGIGPAARRMDGLVQRPTDEIPAEIIAVYATTVELGSFLELDRSLQIRPDSAASPLDPELRRPLADLVRTAAPWVRRFPTAMSLDIESGQFLTNRMLFDPIEASFDRAHAVRLISEQDYQLLRALLEAARRGDFQGKKAGGWSLQSSRNLLVAAATIIATGLTSVYLGAVGSALATEFPVAMKSADFIAGEEFEHRGHPGRCARRSSFGDDGPDQEPEDPRRVSAAVTSRGAPRSCGERIKTAQGLARRRWPCLRFDVHAAVLSPPRLRYLPPMPDDGATIQIDPELTSKLKQVAEARGVSLETCVLIALQDAVDRTAEIAELQRICDETMEQGTGIPWEEFRPRLLNLGKRRHKPAAE